MGQRLGEGQARLGQGLDCGHRVREGWGEVRGQGWNWVAGVSTHITVTLKVLGM